MKPTFFKGIALGAATSVLAIAATNTLAGTGVGGVFNLGQVNTVNATSDLYGTTDGPQLRVTNVANTAQPAIRAYSKNGTGVHGLHTATDGKSPGVEGDSSATNGGVGVFGKAAWGAGVLGQGGSPSSVKAPSTFAGVAGDSSDFLGVSGTSDKQPGVQGLSDDSSGVVGVSYHEFGVSAWSNAMAGVHGDTSATGDVRDAGVLGEGYVGVRGESNNFQGVSGFSAHNAGVFGSTEDGFAGYFIGPTEQHGDLNVYDHPLNVQNGRTKLASGGGFHSGTSATLQAENEGPSGEAAWLRLGSSSNSKGVLALIKQAAGTGDFIDCYTQSGGFTHTCSINSAGTFVGHSDFAESLPAVGGPARYGVGDVLVASTRRPGAVELSRRAADPAVLGVYSGRPGVLGAGATARVARSEIPVAITGIVPVNASAENGAIRPGDLLTTSSSPGRVMRAAANPRTGTIVGKALGALARGHGLVKALVMQR